jgi:hypothetical protein
MENNESNKMEFLKALNYLPIIRKNIITCAQEIIKKPTSNHEQLIDTYVKNIVDEIKSKNILNDKSDENILLIDTSLKQLLTAQIPFSIMAERIRKKPLPPFLEQFNK